MLATGLGALGWWTSTRPVPDVQSASTVVAPAAPATAPAPAPAPAMAVAGQGSASAAPLTRRWPLPAIPTLTTAELLAGHSKDWRVARLQENTAVLVLEFPSLAVQGAAMNRMAALLEKADAPRDRVLSDVELASFIARLGDNAQTFYQGHDYDGASLARFFGLVARQRQPLNAEEQRLRALLLAAGILVEGADGLQAPGSQAMITFSATQADDPGTPMDETVDERRREAVLRHELSHGQYFTRPDYREHCKRFWREVLSEPQREAIRRYLAGLGYDRSNEELMLNEAQAFLMHTSDARAFHAGLIGMTEPALAELRTRFWRSLPIR